MFQEKSKKIKLLILDCDGVLTDGKIIYNNQRIEAKNFSAKDGLGIKMLAFTDIEPAIITGRESALLAQRCDDLGIKHIYQKIDNKRKYAEFLLSKLELTWENVAYLGDDWNDFPVMEKAALTACPADAFEDFANTVDFVCKRKGGEGAVREFIEYILKQSGKYEKTKQALINYFKTA